MSTNSGEKVSDLQLSRVIKDSAHQIWLAGLGAYARAEAEGSKLFESLAKIGERLEKTAKERMTAPLRAAEDTVSGVRVTASDTWERLEKVFEARVARALHSLQIPTARDVKELTDRVEALQKAVDELTDGRTPPPARATGNGKGAKARKASPSKAKGATAKKTTRKAATRRKTSAKTTAKSGEAGA